MSRRGGNTTRTLLERISATVSSGDCQESKPWRNVMTNQKCHGVSRPFSSRVLAGDTGIPDLMAKKFAELCDKYTSWRAWSVTWTTYQREEWTVCGPPATRFAAGPIKCNSRQKSNMLDGHLLIGFVQTLYDPSALKPVKLSRQKMRIQQGCPPGRPALVFFSYPNSA